MLSQEAFQLQEHIATSRTPIPTRDPSLARAIARQPTQLAEDPQTPPPDLSGPRRRRRAIITPGSLSRPLSVRPRITQSPTQARPSTISSEASSRPSIRELFARRAYFPRRRARPKGATLTNGLKEDHEALLEPLLQDEALQTLIAYSSAYIPEKRIHFRQAIAFQGAARRAAEGFLARPSEKRLLDFLLLPRVLGIGYEKGSLVSLLKAYPTTRPDPLGSRIESTSPEPLSSPDPAKKAIKLLEKGYIGKASRALYDNAPLAPDTEENQQALREKHPIGPRDPLRG